MHVHVRYQLVFKTMLCILHISKAYTAYTGARHGVNVLTKYVRLYVTL